MTTEIKEKIDKLLNIDTKNIDKVDLNKVYAKIFKYDSGNELKIRDLIKAKDSNKETFVYKLQDNLSKSLLDKYLTPEEYDYNQYFYFGIENGVLYFVPVYHVKNHGAIITPDSQYKAIIKTLKKRLKTLK